MLMQLVALGVELIDNAALGNDEDDKEKEAAEDPLLNAAVDLEGYLLSHAKRFGIKDIVQPESDGSGDNYSEEFLEDHQTISQNAYLNKAAEIASFQLGMRDYKEKFGVDSLDNMPPQEGVDKIMSFSMKYLNEIFENGFGNFHLKSESPARIISLSSE